MPRVTFVLAILLLLPTAAFAEVMDKEFSLAEIGMATLAASILVYIGARRRSLVLLTLGGLTAGVFLIAHFSELLDPHILNAIAREAGAHYIVASLSAPILIVAAGLAGWRGRSMQNGA